MFSYRYTGTASLEETEGPVYVLSLFSSMFLRLTELYLGKRSFFLTEVS